MAKKIIKEFPVNRVEGDLELRVELDDGQVSDAWCSGTMFRGFEGLLKGRGALDGLVITPRICGICGTAHLTAASRALDAITGVSIPANGIRLRNVTLMVEHLQSDIRHFALMFMPDLCHLAYEKRAFFDEAVARYQPLRGRLTHATIRETKKVLEIVAILGGQWPHSSFMVPGGVVSLPDTDDLLQCKALIRNYRRWYEEDILGCSLDCVHDFGCGSDLDRWRSDAAAHAASELGFFLAVADDLGFRELGNWNANYVSFGGFDIPEGSAVPEGAGGKLVPAGFARGTVVESFDHLKIAEHVAYSWYRDYEGGRHPFWGETQPFASGSEGDKYSWAKAVRYDDQPAETGPLAEFVIAQHPLFVDLAKMGPNVFCRELARLLRPAFLFPVVETWIDEMLSCAREPYYVKPEEMVEGEGVGLTQATRGALGHWLRLREGRIHHYQIITPTAWHASPRDTSGRRGPFEEALLGTRLADPDNPIELGHIVRSFDACLVCTVHALSRRRQHGKLTIG